MKQQKIQAFTLIELIVVITILAILGTIAFISLQGYSSSARDSRRVSDIEKIKKSLELFSLNTGKYPLPDNGQVVSYSGELARTQGIIGDNVTTNLSKNLNTKPTDPLTNSEYIYSTIGSQTKYELLSIYESNPISYYNNLLNQTNAVNNTYPKIDGNYNGVFVKTPNYYIPTPSIINAEIQVGGLTLNSTNITSQIITGGNNILVNGTISSQTGGLTGMKLSVYNGITITKDSSNVAKIALAEKIIGAYTGSILDNQDIYKTILETPLDKLDELINNLLGLNTGNNIKQTTWCKYAETGFSGALGWTNTELKYDELTSKCYVFGDEDSNSINACNKWVTDNVTFGGDYIWVPARNFITDGNGTDLKDSFYQREVIYNSNTYVCRGFAVAKYEMSYDETTMPDAETSSRETRAYNPIKTSISKANRLSIVDISQVDAISKCKSLGGNIHLITDNEWMTIARNIENQNINWSSGIKGTGGLWRGLSNETIYGCNGYVDLTRAEPTGSDCEGTNKNKLVLSNNNEIYDLAGNVREHVNRGNNPTTSSVVVGNGNLCSTSNYWYNNGNPYDTCGIGYGPLLENAKKGSDNGLGYVNNASGNDRVMIRGGIGSDGINSGIYNMTIARASTSYASYIGFRCSR